jgi:iron complex transport system substrate-binding protein
MRIASLLAGATEMVCALGLEDTLVAISHECDYPPGILDRPRVSRPRFNPAGLSSGAIDAAVRSAMAEHGSVYELDAEALRRVAPDLILTQDVCAVCAVPTSLARAAVDVLGGTVRVLSLDAHSVDDILRCIQDIGEAAAIPHRAEQLVAALKERIVAVHSAVADRARPRVLALEWLDPPFAPGHWGPEMIALAGGENLVGSPHERSRQVTWENVSGLDPDVLLIMPCGYGLAASRHEAEQHADRLRAIAPRALAGGRVWVLDGSAYMNRSGPRAVDGIEVLGRILHPDVFPAVRLEGRAEVWRG